MNTLNIIILTLLIYSVLAVAIYFISGENDDVLVYFGMGIAGWALLILFQIIASIQRLIKYYDKRSIFKEESTGNKYVCHLKDTDDIYCWTKGYKLVKRYAPKSEWKDLPYFDKEFIDRSKRNCDNCKHDRVCAHGGAYVKCKHDEYGTVTEFDKFEEVQKTLWKQC